MKYSPKMLQAHRDTMKAYQEIIAFAEDRNNSEDAVKRKAWRFPRFRDCNYCEAAKEGQISLNCAKCILSGSDQNYCACERGHLADTRQEICDSNKGTRQRIIDAFTHRLDVLSLEVSMALTGDN